MDKIVLEHVKFTYSAGTPFERRALDDVSVRFAEGKITGVIGHTGSGKSTMMLLLNGLEKPESGRILLDGYDINSTVEDVLDEWLKLPEYGGVESGKKPHGFALRSARKKIKKEIADRKRNLCFRVGLVMQYPEYQLFEETVRKDIAYGPTNMGLPEEEIQNRVTEAIRFSGLEESLLDKSPFDLSGGQKRRVAIAGVIAMKPEVLVLDEPAAGLDPRGREQIFREIREYQRSTGSTVIVVSHSMEDMAEYCDNMVVLSGGKIIRSGSREEVFSDLALLEQAGLDIPQITQLTNLLKKRGLELPENVYTVDRAVELLRILSERKGGSRQ